MSCIVLGGLRYRPPRGADRALAPSVDRVLASGVDRVLAPGVHAWVWAIGSALLAAIGLPMGHVEGAAFVVLGWGAGVAVYGAAVSLGRVERLHRQLLARASSRGRSDR